MIIEKNFKTEILPHLNASYNLAVWLLRNPHDAEDVVQEAFLRAYNHYNRFDHQHPRAWILKIVYNCCQTALKRASRTQKNIIHLEQIVSSDPHLAVSLAGGGSAFPAPDTALLQANEHQRLYQVLDQLSPTSKEVIVLREFEELSYKEMADILGIPLGTVMSRLSRARGQMLEQLKQYENEGHEHELP